MAAFPPRAWMFGGVDSDDSIACEAQNRDLGPPPEASPAWNSAIDPPLPVILVPKAVHSCFRW